VNFTSSPAQHRVLLCDRLWQSCGRPLCSSNRRGLTQRRCQRSAAAPPADVWGTVSPSVCQILLRAGSWASPALLAPRGDRRPRRLCREKGLAALCLGRAGTLPSPAGSAAPLRQWGERPTRGWVSPGAGLGVTCQEQTPAPILAASGALVRVKGSSNCSFPSTALRWSGALRTW